MSKEVKVSKETKKGNSVRKSLRNLRRVNSIIKQANRIHKTGSFQEESEKILALAENITNNLKKVVNPDEVLRYYGLK